MSYLIRKTGGPHCLFSALGFGNRLTIFYFPIKVILLNKYKSIVELYDVSVLNLSLPFFNLNRKNSTTILIIVNAFKFY